MPGLLEEQRGGKRGRRGGQGLKQGATVIIQVRDDDGLAPGGSKGRGEKWVDHGFVLKV